MPKIVDWGPIRAAYEAGSSVADVAEKFGVSVRAVQEHAKRDDWDSSQSAAAKAGRSGNFQPVAVMAQLMNISTGRLYQLAKEGVIPKPDNKGRWELIPCVRGYIAHMQNIVRSRGGDSNVAFERERLTRAMADKEEINVDTLRGNRVAKEEIKAHLLESFALMKQAVNSIPGRCAEQISRETGTEVARVRELLFNEVSQIESGVASKFFEWAARYRAGVGRDPGGAGEVMESSEDKVA